MKKTHRIYKISNTVNEKLYIGITVVSLEMRLRLHKREVKSPKSVQTRPLYQAMHEYGVDKFTISLIEEGEDRVAMFEREAYWIATLGTLAPQGYNALARSTKTHVNNS